jgi:hypothetical protein
MQPRLCLWIVVHFDIGDVRFVMNFDHMIVLRLYIYLTIIGPDFGEVVAFFGLAGMVEEGVSSCSKVFLDVNRVFESESRAVETILIVMSHKFDYDVFGPFITPSPRYSVAAIDVEVAKRWV